MRNIFSTIALLFGSFTLHFIGFGLSQSFGILYSELLEYFKSGKSDTSWIASLNSGLLFGCGASGGILVKHYGCRKVAICGAILATIGMATCMFVNSLYLLYLTYDIIAGITFLTLRREMTEISLSGNLETLSNPQGERPVPEHQKCNESKILRNIRLGLEHID